MDISRQRRQFLLYLGLGVVSAGAATAFRFDSRKATPAATIAPPQHPSTDTMPNSENAALASAANALPDFEGISQWLNSAPKAIADLKGHVILVQFTIV